MYIKRMLAIAGLGALGAWAVPSVVWHGSLSINNYAGNGSPALNHPNAQLWADKSHQAFELYATGTTRYRNLNLQNTAVTNNAVANDYARKQSEFLVIPVAGSVLTTNPRSCIYLGMASGFGSVLSDNWPLGTVDNRWVMLLDNNVMDVSSVSTVNPMFRGLQTMMGFRAVSNSATLWTNNFAPEALAGAYWRNWCYNNLSQWDAWKYAANYMLSNTGIGARISMATAKTSAGVRYSTLNWTNANRDRAPDNADVIFTYNNF